ncbi:MAG: nickel pincer cofactor biosynthesis protein LarB [Candidatus Thermoplasmatota archaeon]|nr:nickel pincer cofactor biosynthesis protein LarB [Candidatus Thermoplasmatota archaeon]
MDDVLRDLIDGRLTLDEAKKELEERLFGSGNHTLDTGRMHRTGIPEVIIAEGKSFIHLEGAVMDFMKRNGKVIVSRIDSETSYRLMDSLKKAMDDVNHEMHDDAAMLVAWKGERKIEDSGGRVGILTAGTSDIPVAREAEIIAGELGCSVKAFHDVGVAGVHRVMTPLKVMKEWGADVLIVAAGREGALPTLVSGLVDIPVIGLPISTGYGIHGKGETALFAMLQSCSPLVVVNIDAGFIAGAVAARIADHRRHRTSY